MAQLTSEQEKEAKQFMMTQMVGIRIIINKIVWDMLVHYMDSPEFKNVMTFLSGDPDAYRKYASSREGCEMLAGVALSNFVLQNVSESMRSELEAIRQTEYRAQFGQNPRPPIT